MAKKCKELGCDLPVFSSGYCRKHLYRVEKYKKMADKIHKNPSKPLSRSKGYKIPPISEKRREGLKIYSKLIKEIDKEAKANNKWYCFFCGLQLGDTCDHHHLKGRENKDLVDKKYIVLAHRTCHRIYHDSPAVTICWFKEYVMRLMDIDLNLAYKELRKLSLE